MKVVHFSLYFTIVSFSRWKSWNVVRDAHFPGQFSPIISSFAIRAPFSPSPFLFFSFERSKLRNGGYFGLNVFVGRWKVHAISGHVAAICQDN